MHPRIQRHISSGRDDPPTVATRFGSCDEPVCAAAIRIDEPDFNVWYDEKDKTWTVAWKWSDDAEPVALRNRVAEYSIPSSARVSYEAEVEEWMVEAL